MIPLGKNGPISGDEIEKYIVNRSIQDVFFTSKFLKENYCTLTREGKTLLTKTQTRFISSN